MRREADGPWKLRRLFTRREKIVCPEVRTAFQNIFHPPDRAPDARLVQPPALGDMEEGAILAPVFERQEHLIFDRELGRPPGDAPPLVQVAGDGFDSKTACFAAVSARSASNFVRASGTALR